jgi:2-C-methyl-D-erythritol 4-phosphate cytidylyltransferase
MAGTPSGVWVIVVAGGSGARFGGSKQFADLAGRTVLDRSVAACRPHAVGVVVVVPPAGPAVVDGADRVVVGGDTRAASVRAGLAAVPADAAVIVVHDAARPLAAPHLFEEVIAAIRSGAVAATPAVPVTDTLRAVGGGTVDRSGLLAVQTPQAFSPAALRAAHDGGLDATDDVGLVEALGHPVAVVPGDRWNLKITEPADLVVAAALLETAEAAR